MTDDVARGEADHGSSPDAPTGPAAWPAPGAADNGGAAPLTAARGDGGVAPGPGGTAGPRRGDHDPGEEDPEWPGPTIEPSTAGGDPPWMPAPWTPAPWTPPQWAAAQETVVSPAGPRGGGRPQGGWRTWLPVAAVAAVVGGGVGAGVTVGLGGGTGSSLTIEEGTATPGAAVLNGNVTIPELVKKVLPAIVSIDVRANGQDDQGTGMIISSSGEVVTNNHVIALAESPGSQAAITVTESGKTTSTKQPAKLIGADPATDVALLQITGASNLPTVVLGNSSKAQVGDAVVAIGNALGLAAGTPTVTQGIVSALGRTVTAGGTTVATETLTNMIQTDAAINFGNSGGPLIDTAGQVIGMNTAIAGGSTASSNAQNIGFAIPSGKIESLLPNLEKGGTIGTGGGVLGVQVETLTTQLRQQYGFTPTQGAVIQTVVPGSPAGRAGLRQGDVIVGVGSTTITSAEQLQTDVQDRKPGDGVQITYYRGYLRKAATVTLESQTQLRAQEQGRSSTTTLGTGATRTAGSGLSPFGI